MNYKKFLLKILNPFIWLINFMNYAGHMHHGAEMYNFAKERGEHYEDESYDFSKDIKYF